jgi:hypothetical protein
MKENVFLNRCLLFIVHCSLFIMLSLTALSWGAGGHRVIGEMSEHLLTDKAKQKITAIFNNSSVAMMSIWGDMMRSDSTYNYTWTWHYTNLDGGLTREAFDTLAIKQTAGENIYQVMTLTAYLKQYPNDTNMLKMLVHIVQDMHCPMHLGRSEDLGGNRIPIKWFDQNINLHSLWDDVFVDFQKFIHH